MDVSHRTELVDHEAWIAPNATVRGDVRIGRSATILFGAVVRGDVERIEIGDYTNIQDLACLHSDPGFPCRIGDRVTVGHGAIVHGAVVESDCLIGIRATVLNGAVIGRGSIVAAGALVTEGKVIPPNSLVMGIPAKVVRESGQREQAMIERGWQHYVEKGRQYRTQFELEQRHRGA
jgi:carbonic anhydrase/acetyltransferase-like protein (isoleucine patch superfamily)